MTLKAMLASIVVRSSEIGVCLCGCDELGDLKVLGRGADFCGGIRKGTIVDTDSVVSSIKRCLIQASCMSNFRILSAYVTIADERIDVIENACCTTISAQPQEISRCDVDNLIRSAKNISLNEEMEIVNTIPGKFTVDEYEEIIDPTRMVGRKLGVVADNILMKTSTIRGILEAVHAAGVRVDGVIAEPIAIGEIYPTLEQKLNGCISVCIGAGETNISVFKDGRLKFSQSIYLGGNHIINDIAVGLNITPKRAEELKNECQIAHYSLVKNDNLLGVDNDVVMLSKRTVRVSQIVEIIEARICEIFSICRDILRGAGMPNDYVSSVIVGGTGIVQMDGVNKVAESIFDMDIYPTGNGDIRKLFSQDMLPVGALKYIIANHKDDIGKISSAVDSLQQVHQAKENFFTRIFELFKSGVAK